MPGYCETKERHEQIEEEPPLRKNVGTPVMLLRTPPSRSSRTFSLGIGATLQGCDEILSGQVQGFRDGLQNGHAKLLLACQNTLVHVPEAPVCGRELGGCGCGERMRMHLGEREVSEHEGNARTEMLLHGVDVPVRRPTLGAVIVGVFDQDHGGVPVAPDVIAQPDRDF